MRRQIVGASDKRVSGVRTYDYIDQDSHAWIGGELGVQTTEILPYAEIDVEHPMMFRTVKNMHSSGTCRMTETEITRTVGDFIADGWVAGMKATLSIPEASAGLSGTVKKVETNKLTIVETMANVSAAYAVIDSSIKPTGTLAGHLIFGRTLIYAQPWYAEFDFEVDQIRSVSYYDYEAKDYADTPEKSFDLGWAVAAYLYRRFSPAFQVIESIHAGLKANDGTTNSQANAKSLMRTVIDDGQGAKYYYATRVRKTPAMDDGKTRKPETLAVLWNEE
jgi:hypothetical protein